MFFYWLLFLINIFKYDLDFSLKISMILDQEDKSSAWLTFYIYFSSRLTAESWDRQARYHRLYLLWAKQLYQSYSSLLLKANSRGMITFSVSWMKIWILLIVILALGSSFKLIGKAFLFNIAVNSDTKQNNQGHNYVMSFYCYLRWSAYYL